MQMQGSRAGNWRVVERRPHTLRATACWDGELTTTGQRGCAWARVVCRITLTSAQRQPAVSGGIVRLEGDNVAAMLEHYTLRFEQLDTWLLLIFNATAPPACCRNARRKAHGDSDGWLRVQALAETVSAILLTLLADTLLYHVLFHQESGNASSWPN